MNSSVLAYLENSADYFPEKCAVTDEKVSYSYSELVKLSSSVGTALSELIASGDAVGIYMEKCADAVAAFFATVYAGGLRFWYSRGGRLGKCGTQALWLDGGGREERHHRFG